MDDSLDTNAFVLGFDLGRAGTPQESTPDISASSLPGDKITTSILRLGVECISKGDGLSGGEDGKELALLLL